MSYQRIFFFLFLLGVIIPAALIWFRLVEIGWDLEVARADLLGFFGTIYGRIVIAWLIISGTSLAVFVTMEALVRQDYYLFWVIPILLVLGIGAALPFYLYLRMPRNG